MVSKKIYPLINLIKNYGPMDSTNMLVELANKHKICARKTVFRLIPELKKHESIKWINKDGADHWVFVDVTDSKNINVQESFEIVDHLIDRVYEQIGIIRKMKKRKITPDEKESIIKNIIEIKKQVLFEEQRLSFYESIGFIERKYKKRFENIESKLRKSNSELDKAVFKFEPIFAANVFERILRFFYDERNTIPK